MKREPSCHDPHAPFETDGSQSGEWSAEDYFKEDTPSARDYREKYVQQANDGQDRRIKCAVAVVADGVGEQPYTRRQKSADY